MGIRHTRQFSPADGPFEGIKSRTFNAVVRDGKTGVEIFRLDNVRAPDYWSERAVRIAASKYFVGRGIHGDPEKRETSVFDMCANVASTIAQAGSDQGYFDSVDSQEAFSDDLTWLLIHQRGAFNSPVWFNVRLWHCYGIPGSGGNWAWDEDTGGAEPVKEVYVRPQASACFIQSVEDTLCGEGGLMDLWASEARVFKRGSGSGTNFSKIRGRGEPLNVGGGSSGLISHLMVGDQSAGSIKSGGTCLAPHQRVYTAMGPIPVVDLAARESFIVLSYDPPSERYKAKRARAWLAGTKNVVRVVTDKGEFEVTDDHPVKLSSGEFVPAGTLRGGQSLFACAVDTQHGHLRVHLRDGRKGKEFLHRLVASDVMQREITNLAVHHKDGNRLNNEPENLEPKPQAEHAREHNLDRVAEGSHLFQTTRYPRAGDANGMHHDSEFWKDEQKVEAYKQKQAAVLLESGRAAAMQACAAEQKLLNTAFRVLNAGYSIDTFEGYVRGRKAVIGRVCSVSKVRRTITDRFGGYEQFVRAVSANNHRVIRVETVGALPVYDVEVECPTADDKSPRTGHNFVIWPDASRTGSGVVVANTRRAAKMVCLDVDHPDIEEFIDWKVREEAKAHTLLDAGWSGGMEGDAYTTVSGQNANNSVRLSDRFMQAVEQDGPWELTARTSGRVAKTLRARDLWEKIVNAAWKVADPGVQFDDTINRWHTTPNAGRINASNPCVEYVSLDDSACNLASLRLTRFLTEEGDFDTEKYIAAARIFTLAMDILVDFASYPTKKICENAHKYRQLGLGYADLGALLLRGGIPYDSEAGRSLGAALAAILTGATYEQSSELAIDQGPFEGYHRDREGVLRVIGQHEEALDRIHWAAHPMLRGLEAPARRLWEQNCVRARSGVGFRNSQASALAPTGTISFLMDCDTTGVEPLLGHIQTKTLAGGGQEVLVNPLIRDVLDELGYPPGKVEAIIEHVMTTGSFEGSPDLLYKHLPVFDTALAPKPEGRVLSWQAHLGMVAAVQPFLSGAVSKTVNLPEDTPPDTIKNIYWQAWVRGVKAVAIYREGCKSAQPVTTKVRKKEEAPAPVTALPTTSPLFSAELQELRTLPLERRIDVLKSLGLLPPDYGAHRAQHKLPEEAHGVTWRPKLDGLKLYVRTGEYTDGRLGEVFVTIAKEGSTLSGMVGMWAKAVSLGLQYGVPLEEFIETFLWTRFEPEGRVEKHPTVRRATSIVDLVMRLVGIKYLGRKDLQHVQEEEKEEEKTVASPSPSLVGEAPLCPNCGTLTQRNGACHRCPNCGESLGCS